MTLKFQIILYTDIDVLKKHAARNLGTEVIGLRMQLHIQSVAKLTCTRGDMLNVECQVTFSSPCIRSMKRKVVNEINRKDALRILQQG
jgi:hypothetical protein